MLDILSLPYFLLLRVAKALWAHFGLACRGFLDRNKPYKNNKPPNSIIAGIRKWCLFSQNEILYTDFYKTHVTLMHMLRTGYEKILLNGSAGDYSTKSGLDAISDKLADKFANICGDIADKYNDWMAQELLCSPSVLHCTVKLVITKDTLSDSKIITIGRSSIDGTVFHNRQVLVGTKSEHGARDNSSFATLLRIDDKHNKWSECVAQRCFFAHNLGEQDQYCSTGVSWKNFYDTTLVCPIRFKSAVNQGSYDVLGFVTFDSLYNIFPFRKDIYQYDCSRAGMLSYTSSLEQNRIFHIAGMFTDALAPLFALYADEQEWIIEEQQYLQKETQSSNTPIS